MLSYNTEQIELPLPSSLHVYVSTISIATKGYCPYMAVAHCPNTHEDHPSGPIMLYVLTDNCNSPWLCPIQALLIPQLARL